MAVIRKLSPEIIGQIAAGEVVERPASAVKELVENSIDAGAKNVTVELREGGVKYLRVSDNGRGIPAEQIRLAFERHATSKIVDVKDLYDIHTLGFRGEALASIAAVSRVTLTTRTETADFGTRAVVEAGEFVDIRQAASPVGTTIVVEDLFLNAPVRLKFLKKPSMEAAMVSDYMLRLILSRPDIAFRFVSQGKTVYHSTGDGRAESALFCLYGREAFRQMQKVSGHMNGVLLSGYVGAGELSRGNRQQQSFFVNGRYFRNGALSRALENGCEGRVMIGRFPMCALFLELPAQQVDVNVHPNKLEVRFQNEQAVAQAVETLVKEAFSGERLGQRLTAVETPGAQAAVGPAKPVIEIVPLKNAFSNMQMEEKAGALPPVHAPQSAVAPVSAPEPNGQTKPPQEEKSGTSAGLTPAEQAALRALKPIEIPASTPAAMRMAQSSSPVRPVFVPAAPVMPPRPAPGGDSAAGDAPGPKPRQEPVQAEQTAFAQVEQSRPLRLVGIVFDTYWIFESGERLLLVDQHAAHERILYDRLMARFESGRISQKLLSPQLVRLTANEMVLMDEAMPVLKEAGFEVEPFDDTCVSVQAIPTLFGENEQPPRELLLEALDEWQAGRGQVTRERIRRRVAQMACKHAIKGGDKLNDEQVEGFLREMLKSETMPTCPHGRPIVTEITRYALEKRFKRIQ